MKTRALLGWTLFSFFALALSATAASAQTGECRGGPNNGEPCTTDADCPRECRSNVAHPVCSDTLPCPNVCQGGDTPGAACSPEGFCPGVCIGGTNPGAACLKLHDPTCTGGGRCSARCGRDQCAKAFCRFPGAAGLLETGDPDEIETEPMVCLADDSRAVN
jgi:hypothetical protein